MKKIFSLLLLAVTFMATAQVANDDCSNATLLAISSPNPITYVNGSLTDASLMNTAVNICTSSTTKDIWYEFTATGAPAHLIQLKNNTNGASIAMALYSDCSTNALMCDSNMIVPENLIMGQNYKIRVFAKDNTSLSLSANFDIRVTTLPQVIAMSEITGEEMINNLLAEESCSVVTNLNSITGTNFNSFNGIGHFYNNGTSFPFDEGIILTSGNILATLGQTGGEVSNPANNPNAWPGDADLNAIMAGIAGTPLPLNTSSLNASVLEFDFIPSGNHISLEYIFASNEYGTFQCMYGDAIAILLTNLTTGVTTNIATVPGTTTPVATFSIRNNSNNPNCSSTNSQYFGTYNTGSSNPIAYKGRTMPLIAESDVTAFTNYHLKIVVADKSDIFYDSAIFINAGSLNLGTFNQTTEITSSNGIILCEGETTVLSVETNEVNNFEWAFNGIAVTDANSASITASEPGEYTVTISNPNISCTASKSITIFGGSGIPQQFQVADYIVTDNDNDGFASFDLSLKTAEINSLLPEDYEISFHETLADAEIEINAIPLLYTNASNPQILYARIEKFDNGCAVIRQFSLSVQSPILAPNGATEQTFYNGETLADLEVEGENVQWYADSSSNTVLPITTLLVDGTTYYASQTINNIESSERLAVTTSLFIIPAPTGDSSQTFNNGETLTDLEVEGENIQWYADASSTLTLSATTLLVDGTTYYASQTVNNTESTERLAITVLLIIVSPPTGASVQTFNNGESLADLEVEGQNIHWYADASSTEPLLEATLLVDGITYYASQTINGVESQDRLAITVFAITPAPTGTSEQSFIQGETLADIEVEGENIQWYDNSGEGPVFPDGTSQPLPLSTLLVDGETYYASQTVYGVESTQRLAVTVNLILGNEDFIFNGLRHYPNPANNVLNIENTVEINSVSIVNALGQSVISQTIKSTTAQVDVSSLSKGIYFVSVNSGNDSKTVKIIKE